MSVDNGQIWQFLNGRQSNRADHYVFMLPDSNINEATSHGFVKYSIRQKADSTGGEVIRNRAGIYFDFNLPVMINETWHTVGLPQVSGLSDVANKKIPGLLCSPNPFSERF